MSSYQNTHRNMDKLKLCEFICKTNYINSIFSCPCGGGQRSAQHPFSMFFFSDRSPKPRPGQEQRGGREGVGPVHDQVSLRIGLERGTFFFKSIKLSATRIFIKQRRLELDQFLIRQLLENGFIFDTYISIYLYIYQVNVQLFIFIQ